MELIHAMEYLFSFCDRLYHKNTKVNVIDVSGKGIALFLREVNNIACVMKHK
jgi:hypothetical protein